MVEVTLLVIQSDAVPPCFGMSSKGTTKCTMPSVVAGQILADVLPSLALERDAVQYCARVGRQYLARTLHRQVLLTGRIHNDTDTPVPRE